jgi:hypothetical protein
VRDCSCPPTFSSVFYGVGDSFRIPREGACEVEDRRFHHEDLAPTPAADDPELYALQLRIEFAAVGAALVSPPARSTPADRAWLRDRHSRLKAQLRPERKRPEPAASARPALDDNDALWARALGVEVDDAGSRDDA